MHAIVRGTATVLTLRSRAPTPAASSSQKAAGATAPGRQPHLGEPGRAGLIKLSHAGPVPARLGSVRRWNPAAPGPNTGEIPGQTKPRLCARERQARRHGLQRQPGHRSGSSAWLWPGGPVAAGGGTATGALARCWARLARYSRQVSQTRKASKMVSAVSPPSSPSPSRPRSSTSSSHPADQAGYRRLEKRPATPRPHQPSSAPRNASPAR